MDQAILEQEVLRLPPRARALLAEALLESLDDDAMREIQAAWGQEAESRLEAFHRGEIKALDGPSVLRGLRSKYQK
jgi:putative addiction module component (TIGR02574 family)